MSFGGNHGLFKYPMPAGYSPLTDALVTKLVSVCGAHVYMYPLYGVILLGSDLVPALC